MSPLLTFIDSNVFIYAVGGAHPLRAEARAFLRSALDSGQPLVSSAEVLQELLHVYLPVGRTGALDAALQLASGLCREIWPVEAADVRFARDLAGSYPGLSARDLIHLATCLRRDVPRLKTFDRGLSAAFAGRS